jgi:hypothetical protein
MSTANLQLPQRSRAWINFLTAFQANLAMSLVYNPVSGGTVSVCYRETRQGKRIPLPTPRVANASGVNRLPLVRTISLDQIQSDMDWLDYRVGRALHGTRFTNLPDDRRISWMGFVEKLGSNAHVHLLVRVPDRG